MFIFLWIVFAAVVGWAATTKGRSFAGYTLLALLLSPLIGIVIVAFLSNVKTEQAAIAAEGERFPCPTCGEKIMKVAKVCHYCKAEVNAGWTERTGTAMP